ncbi:MAG TPA: alpha-L-arabinofuranosidase C-terminal domain-containing protein [Phycisphaerae bacterium]|nr:alpha-L-arabinofuranosidase C-terminal domain-containing protein [Phycisphaerae bacterium]
MRKFAAFAASLAIAVLFGGAAGSRADNTIQIDAAKEGVKVDKEHYGVFLEEIGHGVDGGLYGEMLQNRAFEDAKAPEGFHYQPAGGGRRGSGFRGADAAGGKWVDPGGYATTFVWEADKSLPFWKLIQDGNAAGKMSLDMTNPLNDKSPRSCKLEITDIPAGGRVGIANEGWCAQPGEGEIGIKQGEKYILTFYAKSANGFDGTVSASVENNGLETNAAEVSGIGAEWKQFKTELTATKTDGKAWFVLSTKSKGTVWFDMVSLFPAKTFKDRPNGLRTDIAQMIADMKPGFVRFPGGCVVEAATVETAYNWKNTIGPVAERPEVWNAWDYRRTHGMGMFEYLQFIEDIGATPMYVGFAGQTCIYRAPEVVPMDQMQPYVDSYLDLIEYANGAPTTKFGKMRADSGHPAPFNMHIMEIGNENNTQAYTDRYSLIFSALKAKHPEVQTIADNPQQQMRGATVEMVDDHHYADPNYFINASFDNRSRNQPPLYLGEVAVTSPPQAQRGNVQCALAEGIYLLNGEKNADVVKMVSYAPLLGHVNGLTELAGAPPPWHAMIYFDSNRIYGTASYYLWKTIGINRPDVNLQTKIVSGDAKEGIFGNVGVGTWGTQAEFKDLKVEKDGKTVYASEFGATVPEGWTTEAGQWSIVDGALHQGRSQNAFAYVGDESWTDYTLTLKARKLAGGEGFLVIFGHKGGDRYWWNLGGYGNTQHGIEMNQAVQGQQVRGQIETNRWYDIKIVVKGMNVQCFLDNNLVHNVQVAGTPATLAAVAGRDDAAGEIIVKVINRLAQPQTATLDLAHASVEATAKVTTLAGTRPQDNNSLEAPTRIVPVDKEINNASAKFDYAFPPYSLTVIRLKAKK